MKNGFIHVCFVIDESGSMFSNRQDVIGGFQSMIDEQKAQTNGTCAISLYRFASDVKHDYIGKDVNEINESLTYHPNGMTAMNDGIGTAIYEIGQWLSNMPEEERPEKNLIVIMTDGEENSSKEYSIDKIKEMIKEQTDKYNWSFLYTGTDISDADYSNYLGVTSAFTTRKGHGALYKTIAAVASNYRNFDSTMDYSRKMKSWDTMLSKEANDITANYEAETGNVVNTNTKNA